MSRSRSRRGSAENTLERLGERGLLERLEKLPLAHPGGVVLGIGDDAAAYRPAAGQLVVASTDLLLEEVHFRLETTTAAALGHKSAAVNLSDLAAMGARPRQALLGLGLRPSTTVSFVDGFLEAFTAQLSQHGANLVGGDLSRSPGPLIISVMVLGEAHASALVSRRGARAGDILCVTGWLGEAACGLRLADRSHPGHLRLRRSLERPRPHVREGLYLARSREVGAMIDLSDGLAMDLDRILVASGVGARLRAESLPVSRFLRSGAEALGLDPLQLALAGGEDYCLLASVRPSAFASLASGFRKRFRRELVRVGVVEARSGLRLTRGGRTRRLDPRGFDHFG